MSSSQQQLSSKLKTSGPVEFQMKTSIDGRFSPNEFNQVQFFFFVKLRAELTNKKEEAETVNEFSMAIARILLETL